MLWRSSGDRAALALRPLRTSFSALRLLKILPGGWPMPDGEAIAGASAAPLQSAARILGNAEYPWTVHIVEHGLRNLLGHAGNSRTILLAMMMAMLVFLWGASYSLPARSAAKPQWRACSPTLSLPSHTSFARR